MEKWSPAWKQAQLDRIYREWRDCQRCGLWKEREHVVFGEGNPNADIVWISEAPGEKEDESGRPFQGPAGGLLDYLLEATGIPREDIYLTNILACRPPNNRDPLKPEKDACLPRIYQIVYIVDPLIVVACGKVALTTLAKGRSLSIEKTRGLLFSSPHPEIRVTGENNGMEIPGMIFPRKGDNKRIFTLEYDLVPILHPSYILRKDSYDAKKRTFPKGGLAHKTLDDLRALKERVQRIRAEQERTLTSFERTPR